MIFILSDILLSREWIKYGDRTCKQNNWPLSVFQRRGW